MKRQITFAFYGAKSFGTLTKDYFAKAGFKVVGGSSQNLSFSKGSILLNMVTFNPLNWKSNVTITLADDTVIADFNINTTGQLTTPEEEKLWDVFIENYKLSVTGTLDVASENQRMLKQTRNNNWKYLKWSLIGAVVVGIPCGYLARVTEINSFGPLGAVIGAMLFMTSRVNKERRKRRTMQ